MKKYNEFLNEAVKRPSGLKQLKDNSSTEKINVIDGDIYDIQYGGTHEEEFTYYKRDGNGYIYDKEGHAYDVITYSGSSDSGRIAGGTMNWSCTIKRVLNGKDAYFSGYHGLFSRPSSETASQIVSDIADGMYLEDYMAKHKNDLSSRETFSEIIAKGDANAKTFAQDKEARFLAKQEEFKVRYAQIPNTVYFKITNDVELTHWKYFHKQMPDIVEGIIRPIIRGKLENIFKTKNISSLSGLAGTFKFNVEKSWDNNPAVDTKNGTVVVVNYKDAKVLKTTVDIVLDDNIVIVKDNMSPDMEELFKKVAFAWMKENGRKQGQYVDSNYKKFVGYQKDSIGRTDFSHWVKDGEAKRMAAKEYKKWVESHTWDKQINLTFSLDFIKQFIEEDIENVLDSSNITEEPEQTGEKVAPASELSRAYKESAEKMQKWHDGTRKQNVGAMGDGKLKLSYQVCNDKGFEKEAAILKAEANRRGLVLENFFTAEEFYEVFIPLNERKERRYTFIFIDMHGDEQEESFYDKDETGAYNQLLDMFDVKEVIDVEVE